jgi:hypothetical protein
MVFYRLLITDLRDYKISEVCEIQELLPVVLLEELLLLFTHSAFIHFLRQAGATKADTKVGLRLIILKATRQAHEIIVVVPRAAPLHSILTGFWS